MSDSSSSNTPSNRPTLKLKTSARKSPPETKITPSKAQSKLTQKPGAAWSDDFKRRMQEDMDALIQR